MRLSQVKNKIIKDTAVLNSFAVIIIIGDFY